MVKHGNEGSDEVADFDLGESSVYGDSQTETDGDGLATADRIDRLEAVAGGADDEASVFKGKLARQIDTLNASIDEELDALKVDLVQDDDSFGARDGSGRIVDDVAEEQIAAFTEVGPMAEDRGGESVAPGNDDTSAALRRRHPHPETDDDSQAIV